ncbi:MAG: hypothetical protein ACE145_18220 [Terriglobia bacterium]
MPEPKANPPQAKSARKTVKRAAMGALFFLILFIPRIRRLRRRVWAWTLVRIAGAVLGCTLIWHSKGVGWLVGGVILVVLGVLVRAKPQVKSVEEKARELGALVVLNGGTFFGPDGEGHPDARVLVFAERLLIFDPRDKEVTEIALSGLRQFSVRPVHTNLTEEVEAWELEIVAEPASARFRYEGFFAEHLARVAETTLRNLRAQELPVLK